MWVVAGFPGSWTTFFYHPWDRGRLPQSTSGAGRPGIPFVWVNFQWNSRASFADYTGERKVVMTSSVYFFITTFLVNTRGCVVSHTSVLRRQGASFLGRYSAEERFLGRLWWWRLGGLDPCLWGDSGRWAGSHRSDSGISNTTGGVQHG